MAVANKKAYLSSPKINKSPANETAGLLFLGNSDEAFVNFLIFLLQAYVAMNYNLTGTPRSFKYSFACLMVYSLK
jgi:hypothetical protein